jgi:hypothetical protein
VQTDEMDAREWRIGGADRNLYVEVRAPGRPPEVLARKADVATKSRPHTLGLIKRGRGVRVLWDGVPISAEPIALPGRWRAKVGLVAYAHTGTASFSVSDLRFSAYPYSVRATSASPDAAEVRDLSRDADAIAAISPPWASVEELSVREHPFDRDLFRILSRKFAWDVMPSVAARGTAPADPTRWASNLARRAVEQRFDGLTLHLEGASAEAGESWSNTARTMDESLRRSGMRFFVTGRSPVAAGTR